jgi:tetratricopeptide repeat protein
VSRRDPSARVGDDELMEMLLPALDDRPGPARRMPAQRSLMMIDQALDIAFDATPAATPVATRGQALRQPGMASTSSAWAASGLAGSGSSDAGVDLAAAAAAASRGSGARFRRSPLQLALVAAALLVAVGGASAGIYFQVASAPERHAPTPLPTSPPRHHAEVAPPAPPVVEPVREPDIEPDVVTGDSELGTDLEIEGMEFPTDSIGRSRRDSDSAPADATPEDLLRLANDRRRAKRWGDADEIYRRVMRDHASSGSAYVAMVASASLHLDHLDDAAGARKLFRQALRRQPDGSLVEEARFGLAESERALGDEAAERAALQAFVAAHPDSPLAERARARLRQIGGTVGGSVDGPAGRPRK